jgi:hypothetical protein
MSVGSVQDHLELPVWECRTIAPIRRTRLIKALIAAFVVFLIATFPATWLLMLFLGNLGADLSYWGTLPLGILVSVLLAGASSRATLA